VIAGQKMRRRVLYELKRNPSPVSLLQRVNKLAVAIPEILVDDFDLTFELDLWCSGFPLSRGHRIHGVRVRVVCENECAREENGAGENRAAEDPRGTDLYLHGGTFLTAMIATSTLQREITGVQ
jgi:hypothetical protein